MKKVVGIYARVSTPEQAVNGNSIDEQLLRMRSYCEAKDYKIYKEYVDAGFSGGSTNRPALKELLNDINNGRIEAVVVYKLDRLSRSQKDTLQLIEESFLAHSVDFISITENFDTITPFGKAMIGILAVFAQLEREQIKERMAMGKDARFKEGKWHGGGNAPIGYDYKNDLLVVNEFEKMMVVKAFKMASEGVPILTIVTNFNSLGYRHKYGKWTHYRMSTVLKNKTYTGLVTHGGKWTKGLHEAFVSEELFSDVQKILNARTNKYLASNNQPGQSSTYLGGLLYCKQCGARFTRISVTISGPNKKYHYRHFVCASRSKQRKHLIVDPNCHNKRWEVDELTDIVFNEIRKLEADPEGIRDISDNDISDNSLDLVKSELAKIDDKRKKYIDLYAVDGIPIDILTDKMNELNTQYEQLSEQLTAAPTKLSSDEAVKLVSNFSDVLDKGSFSEVRELVHTLIDKIEIDDEDVYIHWNF